MYCPTCGKELTHGLVFCNGCGRRVAGEEPAQVVVSEASQNFVLAGILGLPIAGIGIMIGLISVLKKELDLPNDMVFGITMLAFLLLVISEVAFIITLWKRMKQPKPGRAESPAVPQYPAQMKDVEIKSLPESYSQPIGSVTDHTTRQLEYEPISKDKK